MAVQLSEMGELGSLEGWSLFSTCPLDTTWRCPLVSKVGPVWGWQLKPWGQIRSSRDSSKEGAGGRRVNIKDFEVQKRGEEPTDDLGASPQMGVGKSPVGQGEGWSEALQNEELLSLGTFT